MKKLILFFVLLVWAIPAFSDNTFVLDYRGNGFASKVQDVLTDIQIQADYDVRTDGQPIYLGYAIAGKATSDNAWMIYKFTYDASNQMTVKQTSYGTWTGRAALTYK